MKNKYKTGDIVIYSDNKEYEIDKVIETLWFDDSYKYRYHFKFDNDNILKREEDIICIVNKNYFDIRSQKELEQKLKENNLKLYVNYQSAFQDIFNKFQILNQFVVDGYGNFPNISSKLINEYLKEDFCIYQEPLTSYFFNRLLNKIYNCK
jgi:hypothetical protein